MDGSSRLRQFVGFLLGGVLLCAVFSQPVLSATSTSFQMDGSLQHTQSTFSESFSVCSELVFAGRGSSSTSFALMPSLDCGDLVVEDDGGNRHRRQCGNGLTDVGEQCDDGNPFSGDGCSSSCELEYCGDGIIQPELGEACDDGNVITGDGCSLACQIETIVVPSGSGSGSGPSPTPAPGPTPGPSPTPTPTPTPTSIPEIPLFPSAPVCGDGLLDTGETCDDGNTLDGDGCNRRCRKEFRPDQPIELPPVEVVSEIPNDLETYLPPDLISVCGNGVREIGEQCDDGNRRSDDGCSAACFLEVPAQTVVEEPGVEEISREPLIFVRDVFETEAPEDLFATLIYRTDDQTVEFSEQFPEGSGDYDIVVQDEGREYPVTVVETDDGYFSFQSLQELPTGLYQITVQDRLQPERSRTLFLDVDPDRVIEPVQDLRVEIAENGQPVLKGSVPQMATVQIYSDRLGRSYLRAPDEDGELTFDYPDTLNAGDTDRLSVVVQYENGEVSQERMIEISGPLLRFAADEHSGRNCLWILLLYLLISVLVLVKDRRSFLVLAVIISSLTVFAPQPVSAATTTPEVLPYEAVLKTAAGVPITTTHDLRFSFWLDGDFSVGVDRDGAGAIPGAAPGFSGYSEVFTVTPDADGFFQVNIGSNVGSLPDFITTTHLYLQVEVKESGQPNTAYETLDIDGVDNATDRQELGTLPYARNSDFIDNREIGTSSGDIALLGAGDVFPTVFIPGGTDVDTFEIDANDDAPGLIQLSFGDLLNNQILEWDPDGVAPADGWFNFTDDVNIQGDLTVTGTINGITLGAQNVTIQLQPEYQNYTLEPDGTSNRGKLESFFIDEDGAGNPNNFNYFQWSTRQGSLQDMDIVVRYRLDDSFTGFQAVPMVLRYRTTDNNPANNRVDVTVEDSTGTLVPGMTGNTSLTNAGLFTTTSITFGGGTFTAGTEITIKIKLSSVNGNMADISDLSLNLIQ